MMYAQLITLISFFTITSIIIRLIDYWMEGGILRDYFDHKLTNKAHFDKLCKPELYTYGELQWDVNHCEETANIIDIVMLYVPLTLPKIACPS